VNVLLLSTYDMGRQPFGLASPKAWLAREGHSVTCVDLAVDRLPEQAVKEAGLIAIHLPMHTATRLALLVIPRLKRLNPSARIACYGLYAPLNAQLLRDAGVDAIAGGEFEPELVKLARGESAQPISLDKLDFAVPDRAGLAEAGRYARLHSGDETKLVAYTEASRGCKHVCRHCPVVPVYHGNFRVVQRDVVLEDIRRQVGRGARHVTFGDPDFFNGPAHAIRIAEALHAEFPSVTFDATIKIEHLLKHRDLLKPLGEAGCLMITSAVESTDDRVLALLEKNHTRRDFFEAVALTRQAGLILLPTFIAFTPWTTRETYRRLLRDIADLDLVDHVAPIQLALRLLVTSGSRLLELDGLNVGPFDPNALVYPWMHDDPEVDALAARVFQIVKARAGQSRREIFSEISSCAGAAMPENFSLIARAAIPYLDEPWYC
jgi:radical SAM superfamily enzyme YgiQ (UPF0313 family)